MKPVDDNVYIKRGDKYIPYGKQIHQNYLPDGIWYVRHNKHSYSTVNVDKYLAGIFKMSGPPQHIDVPRLCSIYDYTNYIVQHPLYRKLLSESSYNQMSLVTTLIGLILNLNEVYKEREDTEWD